MKTKIIPFNLETAKKIQAGEIKGKIVDNKGFEGKIITFEGVNTPLPVIAKFHFNIGDNIFFVNKNGVSDSMKLFLEVPDNEPQLKPFDKVLCRDNDDEVWKANLFSHEACELSYPYFVCGGSFYKHCIPYEGNEHLVGTTDKPEEN